MKATEASFLVSYGILLIYFIYLIVILSPVYKISKKEETIAIYMGIFIVGLHIVFLILYLISELL